MAIGWVGREAFGTLRAFFMTYTEATMPSDVSTLYEDEDRINRPRSDVQGMGSISP